MSNQETESQISSPVVFTKISSSKLEVGVQIPRSMLASLDVGQYDKIIGSFVKELHDSAVGINTDENGKPTN